MEVAVAENEQSIALTKQHKIGHTGSTHREQSGLAYPNLDSPNTGKIFFSDLELDLISRSQSFLLNTGVPSSLWGRSA